MRLVMQLDLPADARLLPRTRRAIAGYLEEMGGGPEDIDDVVLALDEACANVIRHALPSQPQANFQLSAQVDDDEIIVEVTDAGCGFPVDAVTGQPDDPESTSGRGLRMIRHLMTTVEVESPTAEGGTRLRMRKRLEGTD
ncbi:MAG TPA: ATP-binding protein [Acidimicrobiales bacterium]|nr:ATP-binding protein [Acidimicrobiales bacterium]